MAIFMSESESASLIRGVVPTSSVLMVVGPVLGREWRILRWVLAYYSVSRVDGRRDFGFNMW